MPSLGHIHFTASKMRLVRSPWFCSSSSVLSRTTLPWLMSVIIGGRRSCSAQGAAPSPVERLAWLFRWKGTPGNERPFSLVGKQEPERLPTSCTHCSHQRSPKAAWRLLRKLIPFSGLWLHVSEVSVGKASVLNTVKRCCSTVVASDAALERHGLGYVYALRVCVCVCVCSTYTHMHTDTCTSGDSQTSWTQCVTKSDDIRQEIVPSAPFSHTKPQVLRWWVAHT